MKMLINLDVDGYVTEKERREACVAIVEEYLDSAAISVKVLWCDDETEEELLRQIDN
jgi:hypothetical protein